MYPRVAWFTDLSERAATCIPSLKVVSLLGNSRVQVVLALKETLEASDSRRLEVESLAHRLTEGEGRPFVARVEQGSVGDMAAIYGAQNDLLILGRTGSTALDRLLLGSTAHTVLRTAHCPVLVVGGRPFEEIKRVLCPVDVSAPALMPVEHAARLSLASGAFCTFVAILERGDEVPAEEHLKALERVVRDALEPTLRQKLWARYEVGYADEPADGICAVAEEYDLVVMGSRGRTGIARIVLGSVSETVASRAPVPVLVVRGMA
ncbi:MAG: universal stress protein [Myxococcota bacterium]|nr:universal stress protein [Myxococcota bacterium]